MIEDTLKEREKTYGDYEKVSSLTRSLMASMEYSKNWAELYPFQQEALHMIASKIARILEGGDIEYVDSWHDIAGYATLVEDCLTRERP